MPFMKRYLPLKQWLPQGVSQNVSLRGVVYACLHMALILPIICKHFMIITEKPQEIAEFVIKSLKHDATFIKAEGAYTHNEKTAVHTVCRRFEAVQLQRKIREIDPSAFMIISTSSEIIGRGFRGV